MSSAVSGVHPLETAVRRAPPELKEKRAALSARSGEQRIEHAKLADAGDRALFGNDHVVLVGVIRAHRLESEPRRSVIPEPHALELRGTSWGRLDQAHVR